MRAVLTSLPLLLLLLLLSLSARVRADLPDEDWGYATVRPGAHLFWWFYGMPSVPPSSRASKPWVLWLQGGPGGSSSGFGNFNELGPLDVSLKPRNTTWLSQANLLFLDQPAGTGYSFVDDPSALATDNAQLSVDAVNALAAVVAKYPELQAAPFYIFCESYGGKMATGIANALLRARASGAIKVDLRAVALGDSWISPVDFTNTWAPYLRGFSLVDARDQAALDQSAAAVAAAVAAGQWESATDLWGSLEDDVTMRSDDADFYNVLRHHSPELSAPIASRPLRVRPALARAARRHLSRLHDASLDALMNGPIRQKLGIIPENVTWGGQADMVFGALSGDFMRPLVTGNDSVDALLAGGQLDVVIYNGQLDLICCTMGVEAWMQKLTWSGMPSFYNSPRKTLYPASGDPDLAMYVKESGRLSMYYINLAGHMVPSDNGDASLAMLRRIFAK